MRTVLWLCGCCSSVGRKFACLLGGDALLLLRQLAFHMPVVGRTRVCSRRVASTSRLPG
jgi:hypothetical protein